MKEKGEDKFLTKEELQDVFTLVSERIEKDLKSGLNKKEYLISEILNDYWEAVKTDGTYPKRFKKSVKRNDIQYLTWVTTKSDNNELYLIVAP